MFHCDDRHPPNLGFRLAFLLFILEIDYEVHVYKIGEYLISVIGFKRSYFFLLSL